jgi:BolA protein
MDNSERIIRMRSLLQAALSPSHIEIEDDSHKHAGHEGAKSGGGHFNVLLISDVFANKMPLQRHRLVYSALGDMMQTDIHALSIQAKTPAENA